MPHAAGGRGAEEPCAAEVPFVTLFDLEPKGIRDKPRANNVTGGSSRGARSERRSHSGADKGKPRPEVTVALWCGRPGCTEQARRPHHELFLDNL